ncbi:hypothetical protein APD39_06035 [Acinetobacter pittii]|uniref:hypothetical protein n=1 Tax=Acinetobacter calcoaceticus/baumannii complex TaxID=909768 RepID=UPI000344930B|nr:MULTISPECIES: hypothetical protein [Acinetobacter calcoaceticus/baumannii complex]KCY49811.1 hypothetical protein J715_1527 [Acinetobacter baumannii 1571545]QNY18236.1 hypothetical protein IC765_06200 [Acinetobacter seifertii]KQE20974.1 hypothetical protein APD38_09815 [Acinetobacter pittii]KQE28478.1 hypothetical protein APD39_06035 [Acinetobacter pittii]MBJ9727172.1 hypothetical protein [Acinetobacter nosocomialis]
MTDLNKEREAFLNTFQYYKGRRDIIFSHEHELFMTRSNNPSEIAQKEISNMNSRWDAWLRCAKHRDAELEKAKAQAVPEGYVLMPKVPSEKMFQAYERYSVAPMSTLSKTGYKAMVEAAGDQNENS